MASTHQTFKANQLGRDFIIGDLHGMWDALQEKLRQHAFDKSVDRLFSVGDLIDRGPESENCLRLLLEPWFHSVIGNHEDLMLDADYSGDPQRWYQMGGEWAINLPPEKLAELRALAETMPVTMTIECADGRHVGICHAEYGFRNWKKAEKGKFSKNARHKLIWGRGIISAGKKRKTRNIDLTIHGHTPIPERERLGNALFIDTGCVYNGTLSLLTLEEALGPASV